MPPTTNKKKKRATRASVQSVASILGIPPDEILALIEHGQIKARRFRTRATIDVMSPYDEFVIDYNSALAYEKLHKDQQKARTGASETGGEVKVPEMTRRGSR